MIQAASGASDDRAETSSLSDRIARAQLRLAELNAERERAERVLADLRKEAEPANRLPPSGDATPGPPRTAGEKVALFRSLFSGRVDVFPRFWRNSRTSRTGYSPACENEWVRGVCEKPRVKCGDCANQAFIPVTDRILLDHLQGRHVAGVYPMLRDETCRFLAVDFDKEDWRGDVSAFVDTSRSFDVTGAIERSRSGNGAHVWFFFSAPVPAASARRMGCFLLTATMNRRPELPMSSYDRLFPNQDTLPRGGFGNLIAPCNSKLVELETPSSSMSRSSLIRTSGRSWLRFDVWIPAKSTTSIGWLWKKDR